MGEMRLSFERVNNLLAYDSATGILTWKKRRGSMSAGREAGRAAPDGYREVSIDRFHYRSHWLCWLLYYGSWCEADLIDHRDRDPANNRIGNLRPATFSQNAQNKGRPRIGVGEFKGISRQGGRFSTRITVEGIRRTLGTYTGKPKSRTDGNTKPIPIATFSAPARSRTLARPSRLSAVVGSSAGCDGSHSRAQRTRST